MNEDLRMQDNLTVIVIIWLSILKDVSVKARDGSGIDR